MIATASHEAVRTPVSNPGRAPLWAWLAIIAILLPLYGGVWADLAATWWSDPDASYGMLIPPLALYLAYARRAITRAIPARPSSAGLVLVAAACLLYLAGHVAAELYLTRVSFAVLLAGFAWTFWGWPRLRSLLGILALFATMVPLPALLYNWMAMPLQLLASGVAAEAVRALGIPVYRDGNVLSIPGMSLGVAEACSGLRSLTSVVVLALVLGIVLLPRTGARLLLLAASVPIAILANVARIAITTLLAERWESLAMGFYHGFSGWLMFAGTSALMVALAALLRRVGRRPEGPEGPGVSSQVNPA